MVTQERPQAQPVAAGAPGAQSRPQAHLLGPVYLDLVFSGLSGEPRAGTEVRAQRLGISPGGMANVAIALARLGADVRLSAVFGDDAFGRYLTDTLTDEGVDLTWSRTVPHWNTPVTSAVAISRERGMVTYEEPLPVELTDLLPDEGYHVDGLVFSLVHVSLSWLARAHGTASLVLADVGGDQGADNQAEVLERLSHVDVFLPNKSEALALTRAEDVGQAARALSASGAMTVVKLGATGSAAYGLQLAEPISAPGVPVEMVDTTGAGDVFDAGYVYAALAGWDLEERLLFANLCAAQSVRFVGGSLSAPCWRDISVAWASLRGTELGQKYDFLVPAIEQAHLGPDCRRSHPALARASRRAEVPTA